MKINYFKQLGAYLGILLLTTYCGPTQPEMDDESRLTPEEIRANEQLTIPVKVERANYQTEEMNLVGKEGLSLLGATDAVDYRIGDKDAAGTACQSGYSADNQANLVNYGVSTSIDIYKGDNCAFFIDDITLTLLNEPMVFQFGGVKTVQQHMAQVDHSSLGKVTMLLDITEQLSAVNSNGDSIEMSYRLVFASESLVQLEDSDMWRSHTLAIDGGLEPPEYSLAVTFDNDGIDGPDTNAAGKLKFDFDFTCESDTSSASACGDIDDIANLTYYFGSAISSQVWDSPGQLKDGSASEISAVFDVLDALSVGSGDENFKSLSGNLNSIDIDDELTDQDLHSDVSASAQYTLVLRFDDGVNDNPSYSLYHIHIASDGLNPETSEW